MTQAKSLAIVSMLIVLAAPLFADGTSAEVLSSSSSADWVERSAIVINDDSKFTTLNGVVSGSGIKTDPFIIDGWKIGALENGTAIDIRNTNAHFRIRNVYAYSCSIGINMNNVHNGWVEDSQFMNNAVGVAFFECDDCKVLRSTFEGSDIAISISYSDVSQSGNTFINNDEDVVRNKQDLPWELTGTGLAVCVAIMIPLVAIISVLIFFRFKRYPPPRP